ncbi:hypothetical protein F4819DRAFT_483390 [Hypoxylon fuscum]|nr:hypothetical protein F4819DRAFT_483390 [Hypoxylon fuscum]
MRSAEETQRLSKAARFEDKLQRPKNQLSVLRLLQILTVKEVYGAQEQIALIEAGFRKLQEANAAEGVQNEAIEKQLDELRKDNEGFHQLLSEAEATAKDSKDNLESLRQKVSDEYFGLTADNARFSKDIRTLNKQIDRHWEKVGSVQRAIEYFGSKLPRSHEEIIKLSDTLARLEPMVTSMHEKLDGVSTLASDQKEALVETINDQARIRHFLDAFVPRQDKFFQFLEKLSEMNSPALSTESLLETIATRGDRQRSQSISLGSQPPLKALQMLEQYNHFRSSYRLKRPKSDVRFIRSYLKKLDFKAAWLIQTKLHEEYSDLVDILDNPEKSNKTDVVIFISLDKLCWDQVKLIMHRINGKELFDLLEAEHVQLDIPVPRKRPGLRPKRRRTIYGP